MTKTSNRLDARIKHSRSKKLVPVLVICLLIVGVTGIVLSNVLYAEFTLHTEMPLDVRWQEDPSSDWLLMNSAVSGVVNATNPSTNDYVNVSVTIVLTCPVGMLERNFEIFFGGSEVTSWTNATNVFTGTHSLSDIVPGSSVLYDFSIAFFLGALDGDYSLSITFAGDPL